MPRIAGPCTSHARHMPRIAARCTKRKSTMNLTPVHSPGFLGREQPKLVQRPDYLGRRRARPAGRSEFQTQTPKALVHRQVFLGTSLTNPVQRPVLLGTAQRVDRWRQSEGPNRRHASTALNAWTVRDSLMLQTVVMRPQKASPQARRTTRGDCSLSVSHIPKLSPRPQQIPRRTSRCPRRSTQARQVRLARRDRWCSGERQPLRWGCRGGRAA